MRPAPHRGFTLIEMLVYIAILAVVGAVFVSSLATMVRAQSNIQLYRAVVRTTAVVTDRIARDVRNADSIDDADSVFGSSPGELALVMDEDLNEVAYALTGGAITVAENGGAESALTPNTVTVTSLIFSKVSGGESNGVRVELTYVVDTGRASTTKTISDFAILRGSY